MRFENVKKQIKRGLYLKRGAPDARYPAYKYKYTLYYTGSNGVAAVCKNLKEVLQANEEIDNITVM